MNKLEYLKEFEILWEKARGNMVGYILKKDGYIDDKNDFLIKKIDKCFNDLISKIGEK